MKNSTLMGMLSSIAFLVLMSFSTQAQTVTFHNFTDCDLVVEVGYQSSFAPPCSGTSTTITVPCNSITPYTLPAGNDVFKGYRVDPSGDLSTGVNIVSHCGVYTPNGCTPVTIINPVGCGTCGTANQSCWRNTTPGMPNTGNYDVGFF